MRASRKNSVAAILLLSVVAHSLIPAGFMPGSIGAGDWMMLCPQDSVLAQHNLSGHHHAKGMHANVAATTHDAERHARVLESDECDFQDALVQVLHGPRTLQPFALPPASSEVASLVQIADNRFLIDLPWEARAPPV
ncbi:MAG: hypothetical protein AAF265_13555 [Pseudomonadota bacterium]